MCVQAFRVHFDETLWVARLHNDRYLLKVFSDHTEKNDDKFAFENQTERKYEINSGSSISRTFIFVVVLYMDFDEILWVFRLRNEEYLFEVP